jgi:hypothetical protein
MMPHKNWICNYRPYRVLVKLANYRIIYSEGVGSILFRPIKNGKQYRDVEFTRVLHVPALRNNLLSVLYLTKYKGIDVHISGIQMDFFDRKSWLFNATINDDDIGYLNGSTVDIMESVHLASTLPLDLSLWHKWLGHHNYTDIHKMISNELVDGLVLDSTAEPDPICKPCLAGKMHANPFLSSKHRATEVLELIHSDVHQIGVTSHGGYKYWVSFIDDCSCFKAVLYSPQYVPYGFHMEWGKNLPSPLWNHSTWNPYGIHGLDSMDSTQNPYGMILKSCQNQLKIIIYCVNSIQT